ncbi:unnamed protein product, partial [Closterium sp. NIES-54]
TGAAGGARGYRGASPGGASAGVLGTGGTGAAGGAGTARGGGGATRGTARGTGSRAAVATGAGGSGGATTQPQPYALSRLLSLPPAATEFPVTGSTPPLLFPLLLPGSLLPAPAPHTAVTVSLTARRTHNMTIRPSSVPQRVVLPSPPASSLPHVPDPESNLVRAASPTVTRLLATVLTDPSFESAAASALVAEFVEFAALCRLDYAASLVFYSSCPPSVESELALGCDVFEDRQFELECLTAAAPHLIAMDAEMASWKSTGTYLNEIPPPGANIVDGMWIFRVKRPSGSPPAFKARYVARGFIQREGVEFFQTSSPTPNMTTLRVLLHVAAQRDYELHSLDFSIAFLQVYSIRQAPREWYDTLRTTLADLGFAPSTADPSPFLRTDTSLPPFYVLVYVDDLDFATADTEALVLVKAGLQERHDCTHLDELRSYLGLQITRDRERRTITLTQSHIVHQVLQRFDFTWSSPQPTHLSTGHSLPHPHSHESVEPSGPYPELVGCLMYLMTCTRHDLAYPLSLLALYVAPGRHRKVHWDAAKRVLCYLCSTSGMGLVLGEPGSVVLTGRSDASWADDQTTYRSTQGYSFNLGSGSVSWRSTRSSSALSSSCEAKIYAGAMAAQELRWLTYLLTDLGAFAWGSEGAFAWGVMGAQTRYTNKPFYPNGPSAPAAALTTAATATAATATAATAAPTYRAPMASLRVLAFDHEGRPIQFDTWLDDLQLYLLSDSKDSVSLFELASGAARHHPCCHCHAFEV